MAREQRLLLAHQSLKKGLNDMFASARDIDDRQRREAILQEVQSFAEAIVETVREPLQGLDQDLHVMMANPSCRPT